MGQFWGLVQLGSALRQSMVTRDASNVPKDSSPAPTYRVYGPSGVMPSGTGSLVSKDPAAAGGTITNATNASPIVVTSAGHGLSTGTRVTIAGVLGNTAANGDFNATVIDANTFSLDGTTGNSAYTSGGTWHAAGLWDVNFTPQGANGFVQGGNYAMLVTWTIGGVTAADTFTFTVV